MIEVVILGSAAGGGLPQWNSNAEACRRARSGCIDTPSRTQASIAISGDGENWFVVNASPDLRQQINQTPVLHPRKGLRSTPIAGVILTGAEVDTIAGLLTMRERQCFGIYATRPVLDILDANPIFEALDRRIVARQVIEPGQAIRLTAPDGHSAGLEFTPFSLPGKVPLFAEKGENPAALLDNGETIGLDITDGHARLLFVPGCAVMTDALRDRISGVELVLFDGTLWRDDEMISAGLGEKTGRRMGHMSISGSDGTMAAFQGLDVGRKVLIHMNNSNPVLLADSPERSEVEAAGWDVSFDGMRITL